MYDCCCLLWFVFWSLEAKKNLIQKRKKEKLPVDIVPSSETTNIKGEQVVAVEIDVKNNSGDAKAHSSPPADALSATQGVCIRAL